MKKTGILFLAAALLLTLGACGASRKSADTEGALVEDSVLIVRLEGNPTTGYEWSWALDGGDVLDGVSDYAFLSSDETGLLDGAGGLFEFRFTPAAPGTATLRFSYARSWETAEPLDTRDYAVEVTEAADGALSIHIK